MIRRIAIAGAACFAALATPAASQDTLETREFAEAMVDRLQDAVPEGSFELEPGEPLQINVANTPRFEVGTVNLHRIYGFCLEAPRKECDRQISNLVQMVMEEERAPGPENLRIIVRDAEYWGYIVETIPTEDLPQHQKIGEDLYAILAVDYPRTIAVGVSGVMDDIGVTADAAWERAAENTRDAIPQLPNGSTLADNWSAFEGTEYISSVMFDVNAWAPIAEAAGPDLFITVTSDQFVLAGILPAGDQFDELKQAVLEDCNAAARCISPHVYRYRDGMWVIAD